MPIDDGQRIPDPGFAGDDGAADPALRELLAAYVEGRARQVDVLAAVRASRLLVPVVAVAGEVGADALGLVREKTSDMATVLLTRPDGRRGLLAFTGLDSLAAWDARARPVPVPAALAARAAQQEQADALVVDVAGPARFAIEPPDLQGLAAGWRLTRLGRRSGWIRPPTP